MEETNIRFEDLPEAVQWIKNKLTEIALKIDRMHGNAIEKEEPPQWFSIQELCDYLPEHPAIQTVYTWTSANRIPYYKEGKRIRFLKSEIDKWMLNSKLKSRDELEKEAQNFVESKRKNAFYGTKKRIIEPQLSPMFRTSPSTHFQKRYWKWRMALLILKVSTLSICSCRWFRRLHLPQVMHFR